VGSISEGLDRGVAGSVIEIDNPSDVAVMAWELTMKVR